MIKLYDIPEGSKIICDIKQNGKLTKDAECIFDHLDGMYSVIFTPDHQIIHLAAAAPLVEIKPGYYKIAK